MIKTIHCTGMFVQGAHNGFNRNYLNFFFGITEAWLFNSADLADEFQKASDSTEITLEKKRKLFVVETL